MEFDLVTLRTALIITLSIMVVVLGWMRLRQWMLVRDVPVIKHTELEDLVVAYHPERLHLVVRVPTKQTLNTVLLDASHKQLFQWDDLVLEAGRHTYELQLPELADGSFRLAIHTATQRTERSFRLQRS
ncbi:MAG: hypothetical protein KF905_08020 [Flavobacteriales bacterium]|nr:hypothetical protein [Flavobacteriales bacterium]